MDLTYWFLLPVSIVIAGLANGAGVGGATFFSPLFILALGLEPQVAIGAALITEVFGFASGVSAHARARTVDWKVARLLITVSVPAAVVGSLVAGVVSSTVLKAILGLGLAAIAVAFLRHHELEREDEAIARGEGIVKPAEHRKVVTRRGETIEYELCRRNEGRWFAGLGGLFVGLISTGLGELNSYALVMRCRIPTRVTVATSVVVVAITALAASITHLVDFVSAGTSLETVLALVIFTVPGVVIGGQLGPQLTRQVPEHTLMRFLGVLFVGVSLLTLGEVVFG
ncbi:MAG: sulfite exporter TauE/SafE family protein [Acidimicrobiia bacterium]